MKVNLTKWGVATDRAGLQVCASKLNTLATGNLLNLFADNAYQLGAYLLVSCDSKDEYPEKNTQIW